MNELLLIASIVLMVLGIIGCVVPVVPGLPFSYGALILLRLSSYAYFSTKVLVIFGLLVLGVTVMDYLVPIWGTKRFGGSKWGTTGAMVGMLAGLLLFPPIGLVVGTFFGALAGELLGGKALRPALRASFGSLMGFLVGAVLKIILAGFMLFYYIKAVF